MEKIGPVAKMVIGANRFEHFQVENHGMDMMSGKIILTVPSILSYLDVVIDVMETYARMKRVPCEKAAKLSSAVAEVCVNAMEHGNRLDPSKDIVMTMVWEESQFKVSIRDFGKGDKEPSISMPDITKQIEDKELSGWGLFLASRFVDRIEVKSVPNDGTTTTMTVYTEDQLNNRIEAQ
jgi:serine/threonine-protein kinase RsbW